MPGTEFDLAHLLRPIEPEAFFRATWEKQPLAVARREPDYYRNLFTLRDVDAVIAFSRPKFLEPADFKKDAPAVHGFVQGWLPDDQPLPIPFYPDLAEVHKAFTQGQTVIITAMQHRWGPVAALCRRLEAFFGCPVHANLYLTPPGAQGFDAHYDTHEVFVLQLEGSKHWRFYGVARALPLAEERATLARDQLGPPTQEVFLEAGDLLYMPRGHVHEAFTADRLSLHLTIGVKVYRWADLLQQALEDLSKRDVRLRASLPPGLLIAEPVPASLEGPFRELLQLLAGSAHAEAAVGQLAEKFLGKLAALPAGYFTMPDAERISLETILERAPGAICRVVHAEEGQTGLRFSGGYLEGPAKIVAALHFIARTPRFAVRALPDDLTSDAKLVLARRLVRDNLLVIAPPGPPDNIPPARKNRTQA